MKTLNHYITAFRTLKQGFTQGLGKAPHKPVLLLAVIHGIKTGLITNNKIYITPEIVSYFKSLWNKLVITNHTCNFSLPFYHMSNEKSHFWNINHPYRF